jgi:hypothetical protein
MEQIPNSGELLRRYAILLERLCSPRYALSLTIGVDTDDPSRIDVHDGKLMKQCGVIVRDNDRWGGDILATVNASDLQLDGDHIWSLSTWLRQRQGEVVNMLGVAVLFSHLDDFEQFSTCFGPGAWERACTHVTHRRYGLTFLPAENDSPVRLTFQFHASAIVCATNARLKHAVTEGARDIE